MSIYLHIWRTIGNGANLVASRTFFLRWAHCTHTRTQFYKHLPIHIYTYIYIYSAPLALSQLGNRALMSPRSTAQLIAYEHSGWHISTIIWTYQRNHMNISAQSYEHMNEPYDTPPWTISRGFQWVMSDIFVFMRHVTYEQVISHVHIHTHTHTYTHTRTHTHTHTHTRIHMTKSYHTSPWTISRGFQWVMSDIFAFMSYVTYEQVISHVHTHTYTYTHTHTHTPTHTYEHVISHVFMSHLVRISMSHVTHIHEPCDIWTRDFTRTYTPLKRSIGKPDIYSTQKIYRETR